MKITKTKHNDMRFKFLTAISIITAFVACNEVIDLPSQEDSATIYTAKLEVEADDCAATKVYDADLNWNWEEGDALKGYQMAGQSLRNTLKFALNNASFVCEAFQYMSRDPQPFHFIYPAAAEVSEGVLVAVQDGTWRPLSVTTTEAALIESMPTLSFEVLSAALELRIFNEDKVTPFNVIAAGLISESEFVGRWTLQDDMTYSQSLSGREMIALDINTPIVTFNMPDMPEGYANDVKIYLVLADADGGSMTRELPAMTFVKGKRTVLNLVYTPDPEDGGDPEPDPDQPEEPIVPEPEEPETVTGTFTCATYNVDGLPEKILGFISLNGDGPASDGTKAISQKIATSGWDILTFQENFTYNSELTSSMSSYYTFGSHRTFSLLSALGTADTDGLGFATLNSTCTFSNEYWEAFSDAYGGLTDGANTSLKKGIRHYVVTMKADGVQFDLLVTHMNSGSDSGHNTAREGQLAQIAAYINKIRSNNRPIILMGDTNCRYTRDDMFQYLFNKLDSDLTYADPWVEFSWNGVYPTLGSSSLMVPSKDSASTLTEQTGEVVDKIIYFNNPNSPTQIKANYYLNDTDYAGMADHNPVRAEFTYTHIVSAE